MSERQNGKSEDVLKLGELRVPESDLDKPEVLDRIDDELDKISLHTKPPDDPSEKIINRKFGEVLEVIVEDFQELRQLFPHLFS